MMNRGMALITVLIIVLLLFTLASIFLVLVTNRRNLSERCHESLIALNLAEAGVDYAMWEINFDGADFSSADGWSNVSGVKNKSISSFQDGSGNVYGNIDIEVHNPGTANVTIISTGTLTSISGPAIVKTVQVLLKEHRLFNNAILTANAISLNGTPTVDSYDSSQGNYNELVDGELNIGSEGDVVTNSDADPAVTLSGGVTINGDAATAPGGTVSLGGTSTISGNVSDATYEYMTPVDVPDELESLTSLGDISITHSISSSGNYKYSSINLSGSSTLTLAGDINLYITGDIATGGTSEIIITSGSKVNVYFDGDVSLAGNGVTNNDGFPSDLTFYGTGASNISLAGIGTFYGTFYAPSGAFSITGTSQIFGAIVGDSISHRGTAGIHYDVALKENGPTFGYNGYAWQEK